MVSLKGNKLGLLSRSGLLSLAFLVSSSLAQLGLVAAPVLVPTGATNFTGTIQVTFKSVSQGFIYYTLNGSNPTNRSELYQGNAITLSKTTTVKAVHYSGLFVSEVVTGEYVQAKVATPTASYGGSLSFYPELTCSLSVAKSGANTSIRYTTDGSAPGPASPLYAAPFKILKTASVRAYALASGYADSDPMRVDFTLLVPAATPIASPKSGSFATSSLTIKFSSDTKSPYYRYIVGSPQKPMDSATVLSGDSIRILGSSIGDTTVLRFQALKTGLA
ncbi:MAG: FN3 associated domain-containing protein, partial [Fibrobacteria bacterium]